MTHMKRRSEITEAAIDWWSRSQGEEQVNKGCAMALNEVALQLREPDDSDINQTHEANAQVRYETWVPPAAPVLPEPVRLYVEDFASKFGWEKDSGEGAFEYVQRKSYEQGFEDATTPELKLAPVQEPVAWRYTSRGHYRYRGYVPNFDVEYKVLKPQALCLCTTPPAAQPKE